MKRTMGKRIFFPIYCCFPHFRQIIRNILNVIDFLMDFYDKSAGVKEKEVISGFV